MSNPLFFPFKVLGLIGAAALAGVVGWKLGTYLAEVVTGEREPPWSGLSEMMKEEEKQPEPLCSEGFDPILRA